MKSSRHHRDAGTVSRRRFLGSTAAAAAWAVWPVGAVRGRARRRTYKGVGLGAISYSYRALRPDAEEILDYLVRAGLDTVELMGDPAEAFAGAPPGPPWPEGGFRSMSAEERAAFRAAQNAHEEQVRAWRLSAPMDRFEALGRMYRDEGVEIDILKLGSPGWSDEEIDYAFRAAHAVGARGIAFEISDEAAARMAPFAARHEMVMGMHNHTQVGDEDFSFDVPLSYGPYNMLNLDIGHYVAGTNRSPVPIIEKYHDRITHLHVKDRKRGDNGGDNVPFGEGDTPIGEVLRLIRKEEYPITAMIELEYEVPEGSDVLTEMDKCAAFCRGTLS